MPFTPIDSATIQVGDPLKAELFTTIKEDLDYLDSQINTVLLSAKKVEVFKYLLLNGSSFPTATGLDYYQAVEDFILTDAVIRIFEVGSLTGSVQIDVKRSTTNMDNASFTTVFTTKPSVNYSTAVDYQSSTNQVFDSAQTTINAGDILRLDITGTPSSGVLSKVQLLIYGEK